MRYVVYTEIIGNGTSERWFYGLYSDESVASEVAYDLGNEFPVYHTYCLESEARERNILNLPMGL